MSSGITGPVVVHDGRVYFAQADESLTVLDLARGKVLHRLTSGPDGVRVRGCDAGLLVTDWNQFYLLDLGTLKKRWVIPIDDDIPYTSAEPKGSPEGEDFRPIAGTINAPTRIKYC